MSNEFQGVTFPQQRITPSDDALIRRAILPDGILSGCKISYSGSTLTMAAGKLMICGRQIRHPASQNWPVVDAKTGYARVVLTIDLTRTSTKETFEQVSTALQYADSKNGFPSLEQADINTSGSKYQTVIALVSLGSGGITGIVEQLGSAKIDLGPQLEAAKPKLLWENPVPSQEFGPQSVQIQDLNKYQMITIECRWSSSDATSSGMQLFPVKVFLRGQLSAYVTSPLYFADRHFSIGNGYIDFENAVGAAGPNTEAPEGTLNQRMIPVSIYGIR